MEQIFYIMISICSCMCLCGIYKCVKPNCIKRHTNLVDIEDQTNAKEQSTNKQTVHCVNFEISDLSELSRTSVRSINSDKIKENDCRHSEFI